MNEEVVGVEKAVNNQLGCVGCIRALDDGLLGVLGR